MHGWKSRSALMATLLQIGALCNICDRGDPFASIWRVMPDGTGKSSRGVHQVGMAWHPDTRELWFTDNGRDMLGDEQPNDELNHAARPGLHFGYPYCHEGVIAIRSSARAILLDLRTTAQDGPSRGGAWAEVHTGSMFPAEYKNRLIAQHGSWNRTAQAGPIGYRTAMATIEGNKVVSTSLLPKASCRAESHGAVLSICCRCRTVRCSCQTIRRAQSTGSPTASRRLLRRVSTQQPGDDDGRVDQQHGANRDQRHADARIAGVEANAAQEETARQQQAGTDQSR